MTSSSRASRADEKPAVSGLIPVLLIYNIRRLPPVASFRGARRIEDAPPDRRTHACAERGGEPGIHIPEARVHGFRASPFRRSRNDISDRVPLSNRTVRCRGGKSG